MGHSGVPHFEVHTLAQDRWLIDGIFFDKQTAIDDAKMLLGRTQALDAVRVLQVEEEKSGFYEWTVYAAARPVPQHRSHAGALPDPFSLPTTLPPQRAAAATARRPRARKTSRHAPVLALLTVLVLCGLMIHVVNRERQSNWVWVFDRPEAWQSHPVHSSWTGEAQP